LTIPPVIRPSDQPETDGRLFKFLRRKTQAPPASYDAAAVATRIGETLTQLRTTRERTKLKPVLKRSSKPAASPDCAPVVPTGNADPARKLSLVGKPAAPEIARMPARTRQRRAHRLTASELPWPCAVTTSKGVAVRLLNISTSGILFESSLKFMPDTDASLYLSGPDTKLTLLARFVRSEVSSVDPLGVKYQTAARFSHKVKLFSALSDSKQADEASPQALAELLVAVIAGFNLNGDGNAARRAFEAGLRQMVPSCDIRLHDAVIKPADGCDSIYFTVPSPTGQANAILQVTFDPDHEPSVEEFKLLRSAAGMASVIVQFESTAAATRTA
jgi:hypothetical protein